MAAFTTMAQAEARAKAMKANRTWIDAHEARAMNGTIIVKFKRWTTSSNPQQGEWVETNDDTVV